MQRTSKHIFGRVYKNCFIFNAKNFRTIRLMKTSKNKTIKKRVYKGKTISLDVIEGRVRGRRIRHEVVVFPNCVAILPVIKKGKVILLKQYRFPVEKELWEVPAGKLEKNERPKTGAKRELEEETGFVAGRLERVGEFYVAPGYSTEYMYLFRATSLKKGKQLLDDDEVINRIKVFDLKEVLEMIRNKSIIDAKTILAIMHEIRRIA